MASETEDLGFDLEGPGRPRGRGWRLLLFLAGVAVGVAAALLLPPMVGPHLPAGVWGREEAAEGEVLAKRREEGRLLLTVETERGAALATFGERVAEIDLLVDVGDTIRLGFGRFRPFLEDPEFQGVRKARRAPAGEARPAAEAETRPGAEPPEEADTSGVARPPGGADARPPEGRGSGEPGRSGEGAGCG